MNTILEYKGYHAKVEYDSQDRVLYGKIEDINDYVNFESNDLCDVENEFRNAIDDYLSFCEEVGKAPEKECKNSFESSLEQPPIITPDAVAPLFE